MTRHWKTDESISNPHHRWKDPILDDEFGITKEDWNTTIQSAVTHIRNSADQSIAGRAFLHH